MKVGIDFDRVLFDTEAFKQHVVKEIDGFSETYDQAVTERGMYDPDKHAEVLGISHEHLFEVLKHAHRFLYPDIDDIENVPDSFNVVIASRGDEKFQAMKIENSGAMEHFSEYILVQENSKDEADIDVLVDDREYELERVNLPENRTFLFDREEHSIQDVVNWLRDFQ